MAMKFRTFKNAKFYSSKTKWVKRKWGLIGEVLITKIMSVFYDYPKRTVTIYLFYAINLNIVLF